MRGWRLTLVILALVLVVPTTAALAQPEPQSAVTITVTYPTRIHRGPGLTYAEIGIAEPGERYEALARDRWGYWLLIERRNGGYGWVAEWVVRVNGDPDTLSIASDSENALPAAPTDIPPNDTTPEPVGLTATTIASLRMREGPGTDTETIMVVPINTVIEVVGLHPAGAWVAVRYAGAIGWMYKGYLEGNLSGVPVIDTLAGVSPNPATALSTPVPQAPEDYKVTLTNVNEHTRQIYLRGQQLGNDSHHFSQIGDSDTANISFLRGFDRGPLAYNLGQFTHLQATINYFAGSFDRQGYAAREGMAASAVLNPLWADPRVCSQGEAPLACEYRVNRPAVAIIMVRGSWAVDLNSEFADDIREIIRISIDNGVIPVMSTLAHQSSPMPPVEPQNDTIRALANEYNVPLWDLYQTSQRLPDLGVDNTSHLTVPPHGSSTWLTDSNMGYGMVRRNLEALQVLDALQTQVMQ